MSMLIGRMNLMKKPFLSPSAHSANSGGTINIRKQVYCNSNQITEKTKKQKTNDGTEKASLIQTIKLLVYSFQKLSRHYCAQSVYISKIDGFKILSKQINSQDSLFYVRSPYNNETLQKLVAKSVSESGKPISRQESILRELLSKSMSIRSIHEASFPQSALISKPNFQQLAATKTSPARLSLEVVTPFGSIDLLEDKPKVKPRAIKPKIRYPPVDDSTEARIAITAKIAEFVINCNKNGERPVPYSLNNFIRQQLYKVQYINNCWQPKWLWPTFPILEPKANNQNIEQ